MAQGVLPFKYEEEASSVGLTALGGLPVYLDLAHIAGLSSSIEEDLRVRVGGQGWTDSEVVMSLVLLNLAGGECVEDLRALEADEGFARIVRRVQMHGLKRKERRELERRWRKERKRSVPSSSAVFGGECGLVVDHDLGLEPERGHETVGVGRLVDSQADEGDPIWADQLAGAGVGAL